MHRYPLLFILLLSFVMPLQVAADILLSASSCPEEMTMNMGMEMDMTMGMGMGMDEAGASDTMPCCPDTDDSDKINPCETANSCHLCKTPLQVYLYTPASFSSASSLTIHLKTPPSIVTAFNSASIWRPPSIS